MIVEKIYSPENLENSPKIIDDYDIAIVESLIEEYGEEEIINALNEGNYWGRSGWTSHTGGGESNVKGIGAVLQSIPSLAITTAIAWPVTLFAGIGALTHRIQQRWENKEAWRNRLMPGFWVDAIADPADTGKSYLHKAVSWPVDAVKGISKGALKMLGIGAAGAVGYEAAKKKGIIDKVKDWFKKKTGKDVESATPEDINKFVDSSTGELLPFTPEEIKSLDFKEYFVTFTNGEVIRLLADTKENAKMEANYVIDTLTTKKVYKNMNAAIKTNENYNKYTVPFDNGEIAIVAATNEKEAIATATEQRKLLCNAINNGNKGLIFIEPLVVPKPIVEEISVDSKEISIPKVKNISETKPTVRKTSDEKMPNPLYKTDHLHHMCAAFAEFRFNYPAGNDTDAEQILFDTLGSSKSEIGEAYTNYQSKKDLFKITYGDGDVYVIASTSEYAAKEIADKIHANKITAFTKKASRAGSVELRNLFKFFGDKIKTARDVKALPPQKKHAEKKNWSEAKIIEKYGKGEKDVMVKKNVNVTI